MDLCKSDLDSMHLEVVEIVDCLELVQVAITVNMYKIQHEG